MKNSQIKFGYICDIEFRALDAHKIRQQFQPVYDLIGVIIYLVETSFDPRNATALICDKIT